MNKVFIVECSSGSYEDQRTWIDSIYYDRGKANTRKKEIESEYKAKNDLENPIGHDDYYIMTEEQYKKYEKYLYNRSEGHEFNSATVTGYKIIS